jgi:hypothetical protein
MGTTQSGMLAGTPEFMAPEQARGEPVDHRADLFSLGCVLYCMATGESPFAGSTLLSVIRKVCDEEARPVCEVNPALPGWFGEIVGQLLAKNPAQRSRSAQEVAQVLEQHLARLQRSGGPPVPAGEPELLGDLQQARSPPSRRWTGRMQIAVFSGGAALLGVLALLLVHVATRPPKVGGPGPFHILGANGKASRDYSTLAEAVRAARSGDTIEVGGDGPFELEPVALGDKALTLRAAPGYCPVLVGSPPGGQMLTTEALLVLEGLEFRTEAGGLDRPGRRVARGRPNPAVSSAGAPLFMANCRFQGRPAVLLTNVPYGELRNCEIYTRSDCAVTWLCNEAALSGGDLTNAALRLLMENCVQRGEAMLSLDHQAPRRAAIRLLRNTVAPRAVLVLPTPEPQPGLRIFAGTNVFNPHAFFQRGTRPGTADLKDLLSWEDYHNLFAILYSFHDRELCPAGPEVRDLMAWNRYWSQTNSRSVQLELGLGASLKPARLESPTTRNFELASSDYDQIAAAGGDRAIPYGAALELVGPGPAYDAWRRSAAYQQWLERIRRSER